MRRTSPTFSVVVPTYNRAPLLAQTLDSVLSETEVELEVIVIDDGSTDDTARARKRYERDERLLWIRQENAGQAAARNTGILYARGAYIAFLDSDDLWFPWTPDVLQTALSSNPSAVGIIGKSHEFRSEGHLDAVPQGEAQMKIYASLLEIPSSTVWLGTTACVFRTDTLRGIGGFCSKRMNFEDLDLWLRACDVGPVVQVISPPTVAYRIHDGSETISTHRTLTGVEYIVSTERAGLYPGGRTGRRIRAEYIARLARATSVGLSRRGWRLAALRLFFLGLPANLRCFRFRYIAGFPLFWLSRAAIPRRKVGRA